MAAAIKSLITDGSVSSALVPASLSAISSGGQEESLADDLPVDIAARIRGWAAAESATGKR